MESNKLPQAEQSRREGWEAHSSNSFHSCFLPADHKLLQCKLHDRLQGPARPNSRPAMAFFLSGLFPVKTISREQEMRQPDSLDAQ